MFSFVTSLSFAATSAEPRDPPPQGSYIRGTNGNSNGIVPMLRVFNDTARYVDQGGGKRKGAFAIYLEPWHSDIFDWLDLRKNHGKEEARCRDLFYGLWINDLFMQVGLTPLPSPAVPAHHHHAVPSVQLPIAGNHSQADAQALTHPNLTSAPFPHAEG